MIKIKPFRWTLFLFLVVSGQYAIASDLKPPTTIVVPYKAGGHWDTLARNFAVVTNENHQFNIVNMGGGAGLVAAREFSDLDNSLLVVTSSMLLQNKLSENPIEYLKDMHVIGTLNHTSNYLWVRSDDDHDIASMEDIMTSNSVSVSGNNNVVQRAITTDMLNATYVPYKTSISAIEALLSGNVNVSFSNLDSALPAFENGSIIPLWSTNSSELGYSEFSVLAAHPSLGIETVEKLRAIYSSSEDKFKNRALEYTQDDGCDDECESGNGNAALCAEAMLLKLAGEGDDDGCECESDDGGVSLLCANNQLDRIIKYLDIDVSK